MVKIDRVGGAAGPKKAARTGRASSQQRAGFNARVAGIDAAAAGAGADQIAAAASVGAVDLLVGLQEVGDSVNERSKGRKRGYQMLDMLEDIRRGLLLGTIPAARLNALIKLARRQREAGLDPSLNAILDDIELRAEVELAKLGY